jgi:hypothetical protein
MRRRGRYDDMQSIAESVFITSKDSDAAFQVDWRRFSLDSLVTHALGNQAEDCDRRYEQHEVVEGIP